MICRILNCIICSWMLADNPFLSLQWGNNLELMYDRVLRYPDRVRNLYFTFLFVLRAVTKVSNYCMSLS